MRRNYCSDRRQANHLGTRRTHGLKIVLSLARQETEQRERVLWRGALLVIVEVGVNVTKVPLPCPDRLPPGGKRCSRVATFVSAARAMATQINEVSGAFPWGWRIVVIANTERDVSVAQHAKNVWRVPTRMAEFKAVAAPIRKKCQERAEPARVRLEIWRQLKQDRPGKEADAFQEKTKYRLVSSRQRSTDWVGACDGRRHSAPRFRTGWRNIRADASLPGPWERRGHSVMHSSSPKFQRRHEASGTPIEVSATRTIASHEPPAIARPNSEANSV